jgi:8-amino-7-oxononanoate synthase
MRATIFVATIFMKEQFLINKLQERKNASAFRSLVIQGVQADYNSNDYLGIVKKRLIEKKLHGMEFSHGSTGSRLRAGNYRLVEEVEKEIATFHGAAAGLIFNSGYDANFGLMACIAQRGDQILYDKLIHASLRDGIRQSFATSSSFAHNNLKELEKKLSLRKGNCFVVTESIFSMDGDMAPLIEISRLCDKYEAQLIVDEAHATGVIGTRGEGLVQHLSLSDRCFARIHTFGKALGCHGAIILGSPTLRDYLVNFCRPFIYSTAIPPTSVAAIRASYQIFPEMEKERAHLRELISVFSHPCFKKSDTAIQCFIVPGNEAINKISRKLFENNLDARPAIYPTVPLGEERIRISLHSFNSLEETRRMIELLKNEL